MGLMSYAREAYPLSYALFFLVENEVLRKELFCWSREINCFLKRNLRRHILSKIHQNSIENILNIVKAISMENLLDCTMKAPRKGNWQVRNRKHQNFYCDVKS